jgi:hypothetical protein
MSKWAQVIQDQKAYGGTIKAYCQMKGISKDSYYYWQQQLRGMAIDELAKSLPVAPNNELIKKVSFTEVKMLDTHVPYPQGASEGFLMIELPGIKLKADGLYPVNQIGSLLRELVKSC